MPDSSLSRRSGALGASTAEGAFGFVGLIGLLRAVIGAQKTGRSRANQTSMSSRAVLLSPTDHPAKLVVMNNC
jgi:hypothetical protein